MCKLAPDKHYLMQFDGGSRGNPGLAGTGIALFDVESRTEVWSGYEFLKGKTTNNVAEYMGLVRGLECALSMGVKLISVEGDSELIVKQINGIYKVKNDTLKGLYMQVKNLSLRFKTFSISHIPRDQNKRADVLANKAMDLCSSNLDDGTIHHPSQTNEMNEDHLNSAPGTQQSTSKSLIEVRK